MINKIGFVALLILILYGCDSNRVFEDFQELPNGWALGDTVRFAFALDPEQNPHVITSQFRCDVSYPYSNLYYYFMIEDQKDSILYSNLEEVIFFDIKTGKPLGEGLGDLYHVEDILLGDFNISNQDSITVSLVQYMRLDTLAGVDRVGLRVNYQEED